MSLHPLLGHERARAALSGAHRGGVLPAALLLHGARGVGKQRLALWLARLIVCQAPEGGPCERCPACRMSASLEHPDIHWYFPLPRPKSGSKDRLTEALEAARVEEIAELRSQPLRASHTPDVRGLYLGTVRSIRARAHMRPVMAASPVFIVGDAELLVSQEASPEAANALLKLLEEPPGTCRFILTSSEPGRVLPTIRSRTVPLHLTPLPTADVAAFLEREAAVEPGVASWAASCSHGSPGRALGFLPDGDDPGPLETLRRRARDILSAATATEAPTGYRLALGYPPSGARGLVELFGFVEEWLRDLAAVAAGASASVLNEDAVSTLEAAVAEARIASLDVARAFGAVDRARELARGNVNPQLVISGLVRELRDALSGAHRTKVIA